MNCLGSVNAACKLNYFQFLALNGVCILAYLSSRFAVDTVIKS